MLNPLTVVEGFSYSRCNEEGNPKMRYTTKTANAYLNRYGLSVEQNKTVAATRQNQRCIGWWDVYSTNENGHRSRLTTQPTLTDAMEQAKWHLLEGRPKTAIDMGAASCILPLPIIEADFNTVPEEIFPELCDGYSLACALEPCQTVVMSYRHHYVMFDGLIVDSAYDLATCVHNMTSGYWLTASQSCPDKFRCALPLETGWALNESSRGVWVSFDGFAVDCVPGTAQAYTKIANGEYLTEGECCPVCYSYSPVDALGFQEVVCYSDGDETVIVTPINTDGYTRIAYYQGYPLDECWVDTDGSVLTLDGDCYIGCIYTQYQPPNSYLTEAEYESSKHLMEF